MNDLRFLVCEVAQAKNPEGADCCYDTPVCVLNSSNEVHRFLRKSSSNIRFSVFTIDNEGILTCVKGHGMRWD